MQRRPDRHLCRGHAGAGARRRLDWPEYVFWDALRASAPATRPFARGCAAYQTYQNTGPAGLAHRHARHARRSMRPSTRTGRSGTCTSTPARTGHAHVRADRSVSTNTEHRQVGNVTRPWAAPVARDSRQRAARPPAAAGRAERCGGPRALERSASAWLAEDGVDAYFGARPREHALPDRLRAGRGRGEGRRRLGPVPRRRGRDASSWPTRATGSRRTRSARTRASRTSYGELADALARSCWTACGRSRAAGAGASRRVGGRGGLVSHASGRGSRRRRRTWSWCRPTAGSRRCARSRSPPSSSGSRAACAVADPALEATAAGHPAGRHGARPRAGARVADAHRRRRGARVRRRLPLRAPGGAAAWLARDAARSRSGEVLLFDFGAQVEGYRSDMTRTLFVGEPTARDLGRLRARRARAQAAAIEALARGAAAGPDARPTGPSTRRPAPSSRPPATASTSGTALGHGIGLATHELPSLGRASPDAPLPVADGVQRRAGRLPRRRDRRAHRGPRRLRRRRRRRSSG